MLPLPLIDKCVVCNSLANGFLYLGSECEVSVFLGGGCKLSSQCSKDLISFSAAMMIRSPRSAVFPASSF